MRTRVKLFLKAGVTLVLLGVILLEMDVRKFASLISSADPSLILAAAALQTGILMLCVVRWRTILCSFEICPGFSPLTKITFIGQFFSLFLPSAIGGDVFRAYYLSKRERRGLSLILATTVVERSAGLCALLALGVFFAARERIVVEGVSLFHLFLGLCALYLLANVAMFHSWTQRHLTRFLKYLKLNNVEAKLEFIYDGLTSLRKNKRAIVYCLLLSLVVQFVSIVIMWVAARAIGVDAPFRVFLVFIPVVNLTIMIPLTINGFGLREAVYALLFREIGLPVETSVTLSLLNFLIVTLSSLPGGVIYSLYKKEEHFDQMLTKPESL